MQDFIGLIEDYATEQNITELRNDFLIKNKTVSVLLPFRKDGAVEKLSPDIAEKIARIQYYLENETPVGESELELLADDNWASLILGVKNKPLVVRMEPVEDEWNLEDDLINVQFPDKTSIETIKKKEIEGIIISIQPKAITLDAKLEQAGFDKEEALAAIEKLAYKLITNQPPIIIWDRKPDGLAFDGDVDDAGVEILKILDKDSCYKEYEPFDIEEKLEEIKEDFSNYIDRKFKNMPKKYRKNTQQVNQNKNISWQERVEEARSELGDCINKN